MSKELIRLRDLCMAFDDELVLDHLNLYINDKEFLTLLGPSGCGKTTTLRIIGGFTTPTSGDVLFDGVRINDVPPYKRQINTVFQKYALFPNMTVFENVAFGLRMKRVPDPADPSGKRLVKLSEKEIETQVLSMLETVSLRGFEHRKPDALSGGQQQRVAIARTLAPEPTVLFMDEPLSNLDAKLRLEMRSELQRLHIDTGSTFIYVTHDQMEAMTLATKICLIENGVLQQYDAPLDVYAKPNNVFVADFVGNPAINFIDASGAQQSDGTLTLSALDGMQLSFRPKEPLDVAAWYERADAEDKARRDAENARALDKKSVEKGNKDVLFRYHVARVNETEDFGDEAALTDGDFVLGVRPEFLRLSDSGAIEGEIYSAMPTGMETTVKVRVGSFLLTGVVFGGVLYRIGQKIRLDFQGDGVVLFSRRNGRMIAQGSLSVK